MDICTQIADYPPTISPVELRTTMGSFASGVVVITASLPDGSIHGMTANGFMSVSLDPPLVLVSVGKRAKMHAVLQETTRYAVSILGNHQKHIAQHFAGKPSLTNAHFEWFDDLPVIEDSTGHLSCTTTDPHDAGDHTLFIARVNKLAHSPSAPLTFHAGNFGSIKED